MEVNNVIFNTLRMDAFQDMKSDVQYIEVSVRIPRLILEAAIKDALRRS